MSPTHWPCTSPRTAFPPPVGAGSLSKHCALVLMLLPVRSKLPTLVLLALN